MLKSRSLQAEIFLRPRSRRRFRTFWPSVVRMRIRKPCVLLRLRLLGWKVRFIVLVRDSVCDLRGYPTDGTLGRCSCPA